MIAFTPVNQAVAHPCSINLAGHHKRKHISKEILVKWGIFGDSRHRWMAAEICDIDKEQNVAYFLFFSNDMLVMCIPWSEIAI